MNSNFNNKPPSFVPGPFYLFLILKTSQVQSKFSIALKVILSSLFLVCFSPANADFSDDFSAGNLDKWVLNSPTGGVFSVSDGELLQTNTSPGGLNREIVAKDGNSWSDYTLSFKARVVSGFYSVTSFDIFFRLQNQPTSSSSSYGHPGYFFQLHGGGQVNLFKIDSSGNLVLIQTSSKTIATPNYTGYQVKITAIGNTIKIYVDDVLMIDTIDSTYKSGSIGFSTVHFVGAYDNVKVIDEKTYKITSITPTEAVIGKPTIFEVRGKNLSADMGFTVGDCQYSNVALAGGTPQLQRFVCTQFGAAGTKRGLIKTKPGGTTVYKFNSKAVLVPSTTPMATITGQVKIGSQIGSNIVLSGGDTVNACLTDSTGQFRCQVPENWTGTLIPQAKGVKFSPALISVRNATGTKSLNDTVTKVAFTGTPLDSFPVNGIISSDWKKLTPDQPIWKLEIANGEIDDVKSYEGRFSLRSAKIAANQNASIQTTINVTQASDVVFARRVSSNDGHGVLSFYIDNQAVDSWSGELGWEMQQYPITAGIHTLRWDYKKDNAVAMGADAAWIDAVSYPSSVIAAQTGQTTKTTCEGITAGTLSLMTIKKPTCEQVQAYLAWLKVVRPARFDDSETFVNAINGIEVKNKAVQNYIKWGARLFGYANPLRPGSLVNSVLDLSGQLHSDVGGMVCDQISNNPVHSSACDDAQSGAFTLIAEGLKQAAIGASSSISPWAAFPYAAEKISATYFNLQYAWDANSATEELNSFNIADDFLDEYYKGGMNFTAMCSKYGVICSDLSTALVDAVANKKGYHNDWYGTEYLNDKVVSSINDAIAKYKEALEIAKVVRQLP